MQEMLLASNDDCVESQEMIVLEFIKMRELVPLRNIYLR
jgi:hypothetical protein